MKRKTAFFGVFTALAMIFGYIETLIPIHFGIYGVKLGLANLVIVVALYKMGAAEALCLSIVRIVLTGFMFTNLFSILYSLAGGVLSLAVMTAAKKTDRLSVRGVSMLGGVFHNIGQLLAAMLVVETLSVAYYLPVLLTAGVLTGLVIGAVSGEILKRLERLTF